MSLSKVVRDALEKADESPVGSFAELARDFCGKFLGPEDLSSNPKRLKGYGK
ncbi:MAG: hypothetical protein ACKVPX_01500 [Myxococcaceae bacterium]